MGKIAWFIPKFSWDYNENIASVWIRCLQMLVPLRNVGYRSYINNTQKKTDYSIFVRQQNGAAHALLERRSRQGDKTIFVSVVNYYEMEGNMERVEYRVSETQIEECIRMTASSDGVIAVSKYIEKRARKHNNNVVYIPDSVDSLHFKWKKSKSDFAREKLNLIWCGYAVKATSLNRLKWVLGELPLNLIVISESKPKLEVEFEYVKWDYYKYPRQILRGDICISPRILDNSYDKGHSNFKITPFLYQGVPAVVSPQDSYLEVVLDGKSGFVVNTLEEWFDKLTLLNENRELLESMSVKAIEEASPYTTIRNIQLYDDFFGTLQKN